MTQLSKFFALKELIRTMESTKESVIVRDRLTGSFGCILTSLTSEQIEAMELLAQQVLAVNVK